MTLTAALASQLARLVLSCARREYPNKLDHTMNGAGEVLPPRALHPAFYGCLDWHSAVHGHWTLARLLRAFPALPERGEIVALFDDHFSAEAMAGELRYLSLPNRKTFERTYGWAWLLKLAAELIGTRWSESVTPLAQAFVYRFLDFLPRQTHPIRTGVHPNTAFSLQLALDYPDEALRALIHARALTYYLADRAAPLGYEPSGEDFLSPCLEEAALLSRILPANEFSEWFDRFLPAIQLTPAVVTDRSDGKLVHLDGLNLSRARCLYLLSEFRPSLLTAADQHAAAALPYVLTGNYEGDHWLATFALRSFDAMGSVPGQHRRVGADGIEPS